MSRAVTMRWRFIAVNVALALASLDARAQQTNPATALPTGGRLAGGQATISQSGTAMSIVQGTPRAALDWQSFNIGASASVVFIQPSANAVALNRVLGGSPSQIFGRLSSNGQVFLTNSSGILFGRGAQVDVGGILATTLAMSTDDFMSGHYLLRGDGANSSIVNEGTLHSAPKGYVALIAPVVQNAGVIDATSGTAALVAANAATVDFMADGLIQIKVDQGAINAELTNKGAIRADGGTVFLTANALDSLARSVVNNSGIVEARAVGNVKGVIRLSGGEVNLEPTSSISANGGGQIEVQGGTVLADGRIDASNSSGIGGTIRLLGDMVGLVGNARVDASGDAGGGTVLVGGDRHGNNPDIQNAWRTYVGPDAVIKANAITSGDGGKVIVWADDWTKYYGSIEARGGAHTGDGGFVEVSGKNNLVFDGRADVGAPLGLAGSVLLDPRDITVVPNSTGANDAQVTDSSVLFSDGSSTTNFTISETALEALTGNIVLQAQRDLMIGVNTQAGNLLTGGLTLNNQGPGERVVLQAGRHVEINSPLNTNGASIWLEADSPHVNGYPGGGITNTGSDGAGALRVNAPVRSFNTDSTTGGLITMIAGTNTNGGTTGGGFTLNANVNAGAGGINVALSSASGSPLDFFIGSAGQAQFTSSDTGELLSTGALKIGAATTAGTDGLGTNAINIKVDSLSVGTTAGGPVTLSSSAGSSVELTAGSGGISIDRPLSTNQTTSIDTSGPLTVSASLSTNNNSLTIAAASVSGASLISTGSGTLSCTGTGCPASGPLEWDGGGGSDNSWLNPVNWVGDVLPDATTDVHIASSFTSGVLVAGSGAVAKGLIADAPVAITSPGSLQLTDASQFTRSLVLSGSLTGTGPVAVAGNSGLLTWNAGTMGPGGGFTLGVGSLGTLSGSLALNRQFQNSGTLTLSGATVGGAGSITNAATLIAATGTSNTVNVALSNPTNAVIQVLGSLTAPLFALNQGHITVENGGAFSTGGASLVNAGGGGEILVNAGGAFTAGALDNSGVTTFNGAASVGTLTLSAGTVDGSGNLTVSTNFVGTTDGLGTSFTNLSLTKSGNFAVGALQASQNLALTATNSGDLAINGALAAGGNVTLSSTGAITQSAAITASGLEILGAGGSYTLTNTGNNVATLAANTGSVSYTNANALSIGAVNTTGINATGLVDVRTQTGDLTLNNAIATTSTSTNAVTLVADVAATPNATGTGGNFKNVGAAAITTGSGGAWRIYTGNPTGSVRGGLTEAGKRYNVDDGSDPLASGNRIYFRIQPTLTLTADNKSKTYGDANPAFTATASGLIDGDTVGAAVSSGPSFSVDGTTSTSGQLTAGTLHNITPSAAISGLGYALSYGSGTLTIGQLGITGSVTANNKTYDGNNSAVIATRTLSGAIGGDNVSYTGGTATFSDKNAATGKTVTATGLGLSGTDALNYTVNTTATTTADIGQLGITGSVTANNKTYDGNNSAVIATRTLSGAIGGDNVSYTGGTATFSDKNAATGKTVTATGLGLSGTDALNYTVNTTATTTADIGQLGITGSVTANNKTYDGNNSAVIATRTLSGAIGGDNVSYTGGTATFSDKNAATGKTVTATGLGLSGTDALNYTVNTTATTTADIGQLGITGSVTANNKTYDGNNSAVIATRTLSGAIGGDNVSYTGGTATFSDKNAATGKTVTATGLGLSGTDALNYTVNTTATTTADIGQLGITGSVTANNKTYDGNNSAVIATRTLSGAIGGDNVSYTGGTATFSDKNAATGKTVTATGLGLSGTDALNYTVNTTATTTADIGQLGITGSVTANNKTYDGNNSAVIATRTLSGAIGGDNVSYTGGTATFSDKNAATGKTVTATGLGLSGTDALNYTVNTTATTTADIGQLGITGSVTANNKTYDGNNSAVIATRTLSGAIGGDNVSYTGGTATFSDKNAATGKTVTATGLGLSGTDALNYTVNTTATTTADIGQLGITGSVTANNKTYDGNNSAVIATRTLSGAIGGDNVSYTGGTATFSDKNAATGKTVTATGLGLSGTDALNYTVNTTATTTADIGQLGITGSVTANNKTYDGNNSAVIATRTLSGAIGGDNVSYTGGTATFSDKNAATGKTVTATGLGLSGTDALNYTVNTTATTTADIGQLGITGSVTANNKTYDGNNSAVIATRTLSGAIGGDNVSYTGGTATFSDKNAATGKTVTATGLGLSGTDALNYTVNTTATTTADIGQLGITGSVTANNKTYDGNNSAVIATRTLSGAIGGDNVSYTGGTATFSDKNAATGKTVTATGLGLSGTDALNYTVNTTATTTADIGQLGITGSVTANNKTYDGNNSAVIATRTLSGAIGGDNVSYTGGTATFSDKNAATGKTVTATGLGLSGTDALNYTVNTTATTTADIGQLGITGSVTANNKTYDGNNSAVIATRTLSGAIGGDNVSYTGGTATFSDKNAATGKTVTATGLGLSGTDALNYTVNTTATTTADIGQLGITGSVTANNKTYDGNNSAVIATRTLSGAIGGDNVSYTGGTATFSDKNAATGKTVTATGLGLSGTDALNYTVNTTATTTADIGQLGITGSVTANNKTYDGNNSAVIATRTLSGAIGGDNVSYTGGTATFSDKNAATGKTVTATGLGLSGTDALNYTVNTTATTTADIGQLGITGSVTANNKTYDGNNSAVIATRTLSGAIGGDNVSYTGGTATFSDKNAATGKTVTATGLGLSGTDALNYTVNTTATTTADIGQLGITGSVTANNKTYDGNNSAVIATRTLSGAIGGDNVSYTGGTATFSDKNAATGKTVTATGLGLSGTDALNYTVNTTATTTADIAAAPLTISAVTDLRQYNGTTNSSGTPTMTGTVYAVGGDSLAMSQAFASKNVLGTNGSTLNASFTLADGNGGNNYAVTLQSATGTITAAPLTISAVTDSRQYNGTTSSSGTPTVTGTVYTVGGDSLTTSQAFASKNVLGINGSTLNASYALADGNGGNNYAVTLQSATGTITPAPLTVAPSGVTLTPGATVPTTATITVVSGSIGAGDQLAASLPVSTTATSTSPAGTYSLIPGGVQFVQGAESNYDITYEVGSLTINSAQPSSLTAAITSAVSTATTVATSTISSGTSTTSGATIYATAAPGSATGASTSPVFTVASASSGVGAAAAAAAIASAQLVSNMQDLHARKLNAVVKAVKLLEQDPTIADLDLCGDEALDDCIAMRPTASVSQGGAQHTAKLSYLPGIERKVALLIGIDDYQGGIPMLSSPVKDVQEIGKIMKDKFGYEVRMVLNADKARIVHELNRLILESNDDDSIAIMYAGHGQLVEKTQRGYWIPGKASPDDPKQWISNQDIARALGSISAKQIFLVSDSCYSGTLTREAKIDRTDIPLDPQAVLGRRSVTALSSGGDEPVADEGKDGHSVFAWHLMEQLKAVKDVSLGLGVYEKIAESVKSEIPQTPLYGASPSSGHQRGGDYLFEVRQYR